MSDPEIGTAQTVRLGERLFVVTVTSDLVEGAAAPVTGADLRYQVFLGAADGTATSVPDGPAAIPRCSRPGTRRR